MTSFLGSHALKALTPQPAVTVDQSRCVRHRCVRNECRRCLDVCPSGTITWDERGLQVDSGKCVQCLSCMSVCPTAALQSPEMSLPQILSDLAAHPMPVLGCHRQPEAHARFSCLGYLAHFELMLFLALTHSEGLQINLTTCRECANGHILADVQDTHARLSELKPDHRLKLVRDREKLEYKPTALSRRELFGAFRKRSARTAQVMVERLEVNVRSQPYGTKRLPATRAMLHKAMEGFPEASRHRIARQLFGQVSFTPTCAACGGCAGVCPTGAIRSADDGPPIFNTALCVACNSCQAFCAKRGVVLSRVEQPQPGERGAAGGPVRGRKWLINSFGSVGGQARRVLSSRCRSTGR